MSARAAARSAAAGNRILERHVDRYAKTADRYFAGFYRRVAPAAAAVAAQYVPVKASGTELETAVYASLGSYSWDQETRIFSTAVTPVTLATVEDGARLAAEEVGVAYSFDLNARATRSVQGQVATRIQQVSETSRRKTAAMISDGIEKGLSVEQIVRGVRPGTMSVRGPIPEFPGIRGMVDSWTSTGMPGFRGKGTGYGSRSYLIARTELANSFNLAKIASYRASGVTDFVEVFDGQDCGWSSHDDPDLAHGSIRSLDSAQRQPTAHPRCQRAIAARVDATAERASPYGDARAQGLSVPGATPGIGAVDPLDAAAVKLSGLGQARPTARVAELAQRRWEQARVAEPDVSAALRRVVGDRIVTYEQAVAEAPAAAGGDLAGYAARRKTLASLSRKIATDALEDGISVEAAAAKVADTVRYTVRFSEAEYWAGVRRVCRELADQGNVPVKAKPTWTDLIYRGLNTNWRSPNGTVFEVQFHTPRSFYVKEVLNHKWYEEWRLPKTSAARRAELEAIMRPNTESVPIPTGVAVTLDELVGLTRRETWSILDDVEVVAARARLDELRAQALANPAARLNNAFLEAEEAQRVALANARARIAERIRKLELEEARAALREVDDELGRLGYQMARFDAAMLGRKLTPTELAELAEIQVRREVLVETRRMLSSKVPLEERIGALRPTSDFGGQQATWDTAQGIAAAIERELGLETRWTGRMTIGRSEALGAAGFFDWDGTLDVAKLYAAGQRYGEPGRFRVVLHEMWHSFSNVTKGRDYDGVIGFEEGLVERLTQLTWGRVRDRLGLPPATMPYRAYEQFTRPLERLEDLLTDRGAFRESGAVEKWYRDLLRLDSGTARREAIRAFAERYMEPKWGAANARLDDALRDLDRALSVSKS